MKLKTYFSLKHWISFLRRQSKHMQHIYAFVFAGTVTALIAGFILYTDYGFWHERYRRDEVLVDVATTTTESLSPNEMISNFFKEAHVQLSNVGNVGTAILQGKETYSKVETDNKNK